MLKWVLIKIAVRIKNKSKLEDNMSNPSIFKKSVKTIETSYNYLYLPLFISHPRPH